MFKSLCHFLMDQLSEDLERKVSFTPLRDLSLTLIGRVVISRELSRISLKANVSRLLNPVKGMDFHYLDQNRFTHTFHHKVDLQNALKGCPWSLEKHALLLALRDPKYRPMDQPLNEITVMIRVHNLPMKYCTSNVARTIGSMIVSFVDLPKDGTGEYLHFFRIKITVDVTKPLMRGIHLQSDGKPKEWFQVSYERLPLYLLSLRDIGARRG